MWAMRHASARNRPCCTWWVAAASTVAPAPPRPVCAGVWLRVQLASLLPQNLCSRLCAQGQCNASQLDGLWRQMIAGERPIHIRPVPRGVFGNGNNSVNVKPQPLQTPPLFLRTQKVVFSKKSRTEPIMTEQRLHFHLLAFQRNCSALKIATRGRATTDDRRRVARRVAVGASVSSAGGGANETRK